MLSRKTEGRGKPLRERDVDSLTGGGKIKKRRRTRSLEEEERNRAPASGAVVEGGRGSLASAACQKRGWKG